MRFDRIELFHIKMILRAPFVTSMGIESDEEHIIVRVDGEGVTGWGDISSSNRHYLEEIVEPAFLINSDGTMDVPAGPGIGVEVNLNQLKKMTVRSMVFNTSRNIQGI